MYRVTVYNGSTETVIHEASTDRLDPHLYSCRMTEGQSGEIDSLEFEILPNNPGYSLLASRTTLVKVYNTKTGLSEFDGRVLTVTPEMQDSGLVYKSVVCESRMGYLCDSIQPYTEEATYTISEFLTLLLNNHNSQVEDYKKIYPGTISATASASTGNVTKGLNYQTTWTAINEKLLDTEGGEIQLYTGTDGLLYLDYVDELGSTGEQTIELGKNMRTIKQEIDPTDIITRLIPLGAKLEDSEGNETEERLTIADVNGGEIYIDDEDAQEAYGIVEGTVEWDDVTDASNLLTKAQEWLEGQSLVDQITIDAIDLSLIGLADDSLERGNYYRIINSAIGLDAYFRVVKKTTDICDPSNITYTMGSQDKSISSVVSSASSSASGAVDDAAALAATVSKAVASLVVANAQIATLEATVATISSAYISKLEVNTLLADYIKADLTNFTTAMVGTLLADAGLVTNMVVENEQVTGVLSSVTINADLITTGTLSVKRLLLTGSDGLIYEINATSSGLTETELDDEKYQQYINGTVIVAQSITATQIAAATITATQIAANTITADEMNVSKLSSISADVGKLTAGILKSQNYAEGESGFYIDLDAGTIDCEEFFVTASERILETVSSTYATKATATYYGTCSTAVNNVTKAVECDSFTSDSLVDGVTIRVTFTYANSAYPLYMNVNGTGIRPVYVNNSAWTNGSSHNWSAGATVVFQYDGDATRWNLVETGSYEYAESVVEASLVLEILEDESGVKYGSLSGNADYIKFTSKQFIVEAENFSIDENGVVTAGGFTIGENALYSGEHSAYDSDADGVYVGTDYISLGSGGETFFKNDGTGEIGGIIFDKYNRFYQGTDSLTSDATGMYISMRSSMTDSTGIRMVGNDNWDNAGSLTLTPNTLKIIDRRDEAVSGDAQGYPFISWDLYCLNLGIGDTILASLSSFGTLDLNGNAVPTVKYGSTSSSVSGGAYTYIDITFGITYASAPKVFVSLTGVSASGDGDYGNISASVTSTTTTGCRIYVSNSGSVSRSPGVNWLAVGSTV